MGAGEWVREDLRKPYVIGDYMFVNGVRLGRPAGGAAERASAAGLGEDEFSLDSLRRTGVLKTARWTRLDAERREQPAAEAGRVEAEGRELFRLACSHCHTTAGYLAIEPLVRGRSAEALGTIVDNLAVPVDDSGEVTDWSRPRPHLRTWRGRRMPPFPGNEEERRALAFYLSRVGGAPATLPPGPASGQNPAQKYLEENCFACHGPGGAFPISGRGRTAAQLHEMLGRLPEINEMMPPFDGSDELRKAVAELLAR
jgi:mono/diheme cytochrome c family protein